MAITTFMLPIMLLNATAVALTLRFHVVMMGAELNPEGRRRLEGVPANPFVMLNSGLPALRVMAILFTRAYAGFGSDKLTLAGHLALAAQILAIALMASAAAMTVLGRG